MPPKSTKPKAPAKPAVSKQVLPSMNSMPFDFGSGRMPAGKMEFKMEVSWKPDTKSAAPKTPRKRKTADDVLPPAPKKARASASTTASAKGSKGPSIKKEQNYGFAQTLPSHPSDDGSSYQNSVDPAEAPKPTKLHPVAASMAAARAAGKKVRIISAEDYFSGEYRTQQQDECEARQQAQANVSSGEITRKVDAMYAQPRPTTSKNPRKADALYAQPRPTTSKNTRKPDAMYAQPRPTTSTNRSMYKLLPFTEDERNGDHQHKHIEPNINQTMPTSLPPGHEIYEAQRQPEAQILREIEETEYDPPSYEESFHHQTLPEQQGYQNPYTLKPDSQDRSFKYQHVFDFGKYEEENFEDVARNDPGYVEWCIRDDVGRNRPGLRRDLEVYQRHHR